MKRLSTMLFLFIMTVTASWSQERIFPELKGPYLGQKPPGMTPEIFAPGIISTGAHEGCSSFSPDGKLFLFARAGESLSGIFTMEEINGI